MTIYNVISLGHFVSSISNYKRGRFKRLPDTRDVKVNVEPNGIFYFSTVAVAGKKSYMS